jgi:anti-sigma regulatory factor (Ser/Thr protein kinase)
MSPSAKRLLLHRDLAELERLAVWLEGWAMRDLSASLSFAVQVCLEEAVANIIMYSTSKDDRLEIVVEVERRDQALVLRSRTMAAHLIRRRFHGRPFRLRSPRRRSAISVSI